MVRLLVLGLGVVFGLALLLPGVLGLVLVHAPGTAWAESAEALLGRALALAASLPGLPVDPERAREALLAPPVAHALSVLGALVLAGTPLLARGDAPAASATLAPGKRLGRKVLRQASLLAKKGRQVEAAEICFEAGLHDEAVSYFAAAGEHTRAAEVLHDQNRFQEAADLYVKGGNFEAAGTLLASQNDFRRAAECYARAGRMSVAGEMFERAGDIRRAGNCFTRAGFHRNAVQCYLRNQRWAEAAEALERVLADEAERARSGDPRARREYKTLVLQASKLHDEAGDLQAARAILERNGCFAEAAEIALREQHFAQAAELFLRADQAPRAAEALEHLGEEKAAARVLGEYHRDQGNDVDAARYLEAAGEFVDAGDLHRKLENFEKAGECYERHGDDVQAAEMFKLAGDPARAASNYEGAGRFLEAAECAAMVGDERKRAHMLAKAGQFFAAGELYHREGLDDEAIKVLQRVPSESPDFAAAAAILGGIFRARGLHSLAIKKLEQAIGEAVLGPKNVEAHYQLATVHEAAGDLGRAVDLYERILSVDYHYADVGERLTKARQHLDASSAGAATHVESGQDLTPSSRPGRYEVVDELGRGGMGIVYKARDTVLDRVVAYKVLPDALRENPQALRNFLREAKSAAQLNHPNIVTVYDAGEQDGRFYIAMEYVDGTTLKEILHRRKVIAPNGVLHVLVQMCEALAYAHDKKIVHRDVKTANTMWTKDRKAKIMDFGLAKVVEEVRNHTTLVSGTPYYMSPEQTLGQNVDHRTDIYSLGVTLFELATGTLPFKEGNVPYHHVHTPPPDPREVNPELPAELASVIARCLQKDPAARFQSAREIIAELRAAQTL